MKFVSRLVIAATLVASASAFLNQFSKTSNSNKTPVNTIAARELEAGVCAPFPNLFDPLGLSEGRSYRDLKKFREAELKHGRVAMLAILGTIVQENFHPLFGFGDKEMYGAIFHFQQVEKVLPSLWAFIVLTIGIIEAQGIARLWDAPGSLESGEIAGIREDVICGDYGFDPLNLKKDEERFLDMRTKELNNGRLAMIAAVGVIVQEKFITGGAAEFQLY